MPGRGLPKSEVDPKPPGGMGNGPGPGNTGSPGEPGRPGNPGKSGSPFGCMNREPSLSVAFGEPSASTAEAVLARIANSARGRDVRWYERYLRVFMRVFLLCVDTDCVLPKCLNLW